LVVVGVEAVAAKTHQAQQSMAAAAVAAAAFWI
jgi:hypothetical protein